MQSSIKNTKHDRFNQSNIQNDRADRLIQRDFDWRLRLAHYFSEFYCDNICDGLGDYRYRCYSIYSDNDYPRQTEERTRKRTLETRHLVSFHSCLRAALLKGVIFTSQTLRMIEYVRL